MSMVALIALRGNLQDCFRTVGSDALKRLHSPHPAFGPILFGTRNAHTIDAQTQGFSLENP